MDYVYGVETHHTVSSFFFFNDTATTEIYTLSLHDALPISSDSTTPITRVRWASSCPRSRSSSSRRPARRSEEHTSELQSQSNLVCRLLLEKKKKIHSKHAPRNRDEPLSTHVNDECLPAGLT